MHKIFSGILGVLLLISGQALSQQDIHLSQWTQSPMNLNPATAGVFYGTYRANINYRRQWMSISTPFTTSSVSVDLPVLADVFQNDLFGIGISANQDEAGDAMMKSTRAYLTLSYGKALDIYEEHFLSVGFQAGLASRSIDYTQVYWDEQWAFEGFDLTRLSGEGENVENFGAPGVGASGYADVSTGIHYFYTDRNLFKMNMGMSLLHLNRPNLDFLGVQDKLDRRFIAHFGFSHGIRDNSHFQVSPSVYYSNQQNNRIFMIGTDMTFFFTDATKFTGFKREAGMDLGLHYRWDDAVIGVFRLRFGGLALGVSYDFNISPLTVISQGQGGPEILLSMRGGYKKGHRAAHRHNERFK